jgi:Transketolase
LDGRPSKSTVTTWPRYVRALDEASEVKGVPTAIIARTVKGKGVSFAENTHAYHNNLLTKEQQEQAVREILAM